MHILTIETSTQVCSAAWCIDGQPVIERIHMQGANHAALLPTFIDQIIAEANRNHWVADAVAVSEGPGSYTGLRIGLSTAKGLCYGWQVPLIPIPTLDILCAAAQPLLPATPCTLVPMLDARRMEVYTALYDYDGSAPKRRSEIMAQVVENDAWLPSSPVCYFGDGAAKCQAVLPAEKCVFIDNIVPRATVMGALAEQPSYARLNEKEMAYFTPFYLKDFIAAPSHIKGLQ
ncbi:MAG: tRNA (adenosine(37)-N6)-threonylcarbamoyltransferase complex dimerization subunit type 1 TsaB [Paludibacteraceae bacterium]|nr:tRNA (adenosine(37)-N6)-threonylcarbamoyltransferase complex dimerization subunit type 1 TsaB [Paludibacteraceae bacterium]